MDMHIFVILLYFYVSFALFFPFMFFFHLGLDQTKKSEQTKHQHCYERMVLSSDKTRSLSLELVLRVTLTCPPSFMASIRKRTTSLVGSSSPKSSKEEEEEEEEEI